MASSMRWVNSSVERNCGFQSVWISSDWKTRLLLIMKFLKMFLSCYLRPPRHFIVLFQEWDGGLQHRGLVHLPVVLAHHGAQLSDQRVELVPPLLLRQVPWLPLGLVLLIIVLHVITRHWEGGCSSARCRHRRSSLHYLWEWHNFTLFQFWCFHLEKLGGFDFVD